MSEYWLSWPGTSPHQHVASDRVPTRVHFSRSPLTFRRGAARRASAATAPSCAALRRRAPDRARRHAGWCRPSAARCGRGAVGGSDALRAHTRRAPWRRRRACGRHGWRALARRRNGAGLCGRFGVSGGGGRRAVPSITVRSRQRGGQQLGLRASACRKSAALECHRFHLLRWLGCLRCGRPLALRTRLATGVPLSGGGPMSARVTVPNLSFAVRRL